MDFPVVMYGCESRTVKKSERRNWCFWTMVLKKTLESPLDCKEIQPVHPKEDQSWVFIGRTDAEAETPVLWPPHVKSWLIRKNPDAGRDWGQEEKGTTEGEMVGWHHWLDGHGFEQTPGVGDGQGGLECCDSWGRKESDTTEWLNWTELNGTDSYYYKHLTERHSADRIGYNSKLSNQLFSFPEIAISQVLSLFESILLMWAPLILTFELFHC